MLSSRLYKEVLNGIKDGVYFVDKNRKLTFFNRSAELITGFKADEVLDRHCYDNFLNHVDSAGNELCLGGCPLHASLQDGEIREAAVYLRHKDGHRVPVTVHIMPLIENGEIIGAVETFTDESNNIGFLTDLEELKRLAYNDELTDLPNRRYIDNIIKNKFKTYKNLGLPFAIAIFDIDKFKDFNDTYGHDVGDLVLQMISKIFKGVTRTTDLIGRYGGEEFLGIFEISDIQDLENTLNRIRVLIEKSCINYRNKKLQVTVSVGATIVLENDDEKSILKRSDNMLYNSKRNGRNKVTVG